MPKNKKRGSSKQATGKLVDELRQTFARTSEHEEFYFINLPVKMKLLEFFSDPLLH